MNVSAIEALGRAWNGRADECERLGLQQPATMIRAMAGELGAALVSLLHECLTIDQAAMESGYSYSTLQQRLSDGGDLPNAGSRGSPRVRRCDLPMKGGTRGPSLSADEVDVAGMVLAGRAS